MLSKTKQNSSNFGRQNIQKVHGKFSKMGHPDAKIWSPGEKKWSRPPISFPTNGGKTIENMYKNRHQTAPDKICARKWAKTDRPGAKKWQTPDEKLDKGMQNLVAWRWKSSAPFRRGQLGRKARRLPSFVSYHRVPGRRCANFCVIILRSVLAPHVLRSGGPIFSAPGPKMWSNNETKTYTKKSRTSQLQKAARKQLFAKASRRLARAFAKSCFPQI